MTKTIKVITVNQYNFMMQDICSKYMDYNPGKGRIMNVIGAEEGGVKIIAEYTKSGEKELKSMIEILKKGNIDVKIEA